ncbi:extracellular solute-binding protein [Actibacterium sp. 188UL27-1]|uniref:extracellular solute-binding protein n=1 Tax=Actibacterium sp. 188UL27-1 TaxID=2786961 RepID=UPI0019562704|nr:extracellular solute-binding protein [Actibacterium sp. 188UL27-1]MBM7069579.1 ABC transporter substrate-binding protein [Actibacterium sp. 188UL27-1]
MLSKYFIRSRAIATVVAVTTSVGFASAEPRHGIAMYGDPALPPDFVSLPHVNADAPKGGSVTFAEVGSFDSLHPFILNGSAPYGWRVYGFESLMGRSWDEPFTLYGLLAESVETGPNRDWVEFTLRQEATFSDGSPVTVEDVLWSYEMLGTQGHPRYHSSWAKVAKAEAVGERAVRFTFTRPDNELPLILGLPPILKKAAFDGRAFDRPSMEAPIGSGPYVIEDLNAGRSITLKKNPDWWGSDLPFNRGQHNIDEITYEYFADGDIAFEAFRGGEISYVRETNAAKWDSNYDFPAVATGKVIKSEIPHQRPSGIAGFVMNTRNPLFADWRVREAMIQAFNFEFINRTLNGGSQPRITSYFANSQLAMSDGPADGRVAELLAPFAQDLPPGTIEGYALPVSDGQKANRKGRRAALKLLEEAGWSAESGTLKNADGAPFAFEFLLQAGSAQEANIAELYIEALTALGMDVQITTVDSAQYKERTQIYDFAMTPYSRPMSLSPGTEQRLYWGSDGVEKPGTRNWMGMDSPAAEAMIDTMLTSNSQEDFIASVKALDRILTAGRYVVPIWYQPKSYLAHQADLQYPERLPIYGDWLGFMPDIWWIASQ